MKVLVIGSGGREHALAWKLRASPLVKAIYATPGNPGIAQFAECLAGPQNPESWLEMAERVSADLTVVGPEAPLTVGVVDAFRAAGRRIFGPTAAAARLEGSKQFAKEIMQAAGVPTARFRNAGNLTEAVDAIDAIGTPVVLKADGLAAGKGVIIAEEREEAGRVARALLSGNVVGEAGKRLVVEEFLRGEEVSFIVVACGEEAIPLQPSQDHKAIFDGDRGPNTGGMGAYCDSRILAAEQTTRIMDGIIRPTLSEMRRRGHEFHGFLYAGLMMTDDGPKVLEYNVRMGDPEAQPILHRLESDLAPLLMEVAEGSLPQQSLTWRPDPSVCVVLASRGYPASSESGQPISGLERAEQSGATVFHAGTRVREGRLETAGGRVLGVTASGNNLAASISLAYTAVREIQFDGMQYRTDIGKKGLKRWSS